jgi:alpha-tubulin suppressor-like RCC1 family protein
MIRWSWLALPLLLAACNGGGTDDPDGSVPGDDGAAPVGDSTVPDDASGPDGSDGSMALTCADAPCGPNAQCEDDASGAGFHCTCEEGYEGDPLAGCTAIDWCGQGNDCPEHNVCLNQTDGYVCRCPEGTLDVEGDASECLTVRKSALATHHGCAILSSDALYCWGENPHGQLGTGDYDEHLLPVRVGDEDATWTDVAAGVQHTCAIDSSERLYCWGSHDAGQLGIGDGPSQNEPTRVSSRVLGWRAVVAGGYYTCAITTDDHLMCWGGNGSGQLGLGDDVGRTSPTLVGSTEETWIAVAAGWNHTCAIHDTGTLYCWGSNANDKAGLGEADDTSTPKPVETEVETWRALSVNWNHSCAIDADDALHCWGQNSAGHLGRGHASAQEAPGPVVSDVEAWELVSAGHSSTCAIAAEGSLYCWGDNGQGVLGLGDSGPGTERLSPTRVETGGEAPWSWATANRGASRCAIDATGRLFCWGSNDSGILGLGYGNKTTSPRPIESDVGEWVAVAAGSDHSCAIDGTGALYCWGYNSSGELGLGDTVMRTGPKLVAVDGVDHWTGVTTGNYHTCATDALEQLRCWGYNGDGQLGLGDTGQRTAPALVDSAVSGWRAVSGGHYHTCGLSLDGTLHCWGNNDYGQLGSGAVESPEDEPQPVETDVPAWDAVSAGEYHTCAIASDGPLYCWGKNEDGQLGIESESPFHDSPQRVGGEADRWVDVAAAKHHTCALRSDQVLLCWGDNGNGEVGVGEESEIFPPTPVESTVGEWSALAVGDEHTCAVAGDGVIYCWGGNGDGQLGTGGDDRAYVPTPVVDAEGSWGTVAGGYAHTCGIVEGMVHCWGYARWGQLGLHDLTTPTLVRF